MHTIRPASRIRRTPLSIYTLGEKRNNSVNLTISYDRGQPLGLDGKGPGPLSPSFAATKTEIFTIPFYLINYQSPTCLTTIISHSL